MNIVVITGSPRKQGNSFAMTKAFIDKAEACGHTVRRFDAAFMHIGDAMPVRLVSRRERHVPLTMILTSLRSLSRKRMLWCIPFRCIGTPFRHR